MKTINTGNFTATGIRHNRNCKPVFCISTGQIFTSITDAAEANDVTVSAMSLAVAKKSKICRGRRFCLVSEIPDNIHELAEAIRVGGEKAAKYDAIIAERNHKAEVVKRLERFKTKYTDLQREMEITKRQLDEAEAELNLIG